MQCRIIVIFIILLHCKALKVLCNFDEGWIEPDAWGRERFEADGCPRCVETCTASNKDNTVAFLYYRKFISNLFNRKKLQHDEETDLYHRSIVFTLSATQLEKLESLDDARDFDKVLTEILSNARTAKYISRSGIVNIDAEENHSFIALIWDILKDTLQLLRTSEGQFILLVLTVILLGWYMHRSYKYGIIKMIIFGTLIYGYFHTYLECNRKMESEKMLELFEKHDAADTPATPRWYTSLFNWFSSTDLLKEQQKEEIRKMAKLNLAFCRPDHVFVLYVNDLFFKQLEFLVEKCTISILTLKDKLFFPFNYIAMIMVVAMICFTTKLVFKYILSPRAWASLLHNSNAHQYVHPPLPQQPLQQQQQIPQLTSGVADAREDRISGENLKRLLDVLAPQVATPANKTDTRNALEFSSVQYVFDQLDDEHAEISSSEANTSHNSSTKEAQTSEKTSPNMKLEEFPDSLER